MGDEERLKKATTERTKKMKQTNQKTEEEIDKIIQELLGEEEVTNWICPKCRSYGGEEGFYCPIDGKKLIKETYKYTKHPEILEEWKEIKRKRKND